MNQSDIKKYYKIFGYLNLILSIIFGIIPSEMEIKERMMAVIVINVGYHMLFIFFASIEKDSVRKNNNFNRIIGGAFSKLFAIFGIFCSFILMFVFVSRAITLKEYYGLLTICMPFGLFFGAYSLWVELKNE